MIHDIIAVAVFLITSFAAMFFAVSFIDFLINCFRD